MPRSSARSGQTEPYAALVAVAVVALALGVFATAFEASLPGHAERNVAQPTVDRVERALTVGGVVRPDRLGNATAAGPEGFRTNVTLSAGDRRWSTGPAAPPTSDVASRRVSVFREAGDAVPAQLVVRVWT